MQSIVTVKPHIFDDRGVVNFEMSQGSTVDDFIKKANLPVALNRHIRATVNGIPLEDFSKALKVNDTVNIYVVPMGGGGNKNILRLVAMVAITYFSGGAGAALFGANTLGASVATMAFTAVGMLAVNALIPPPKLDTGGYNSTSASDNIYSITGQSNKMSPYGVVPRIYGTHLFFPRLAGQPLIWNTGSSSYMRGLYDFGYAKISLYDIRIGNTSIDNYRVDTNIVDTVNGDNLKFYTRNVDIQNVGIALKYNTPQVRETASDCNSCELEVAFPRGLVEIDKRGKYKNRSVALKALYRLAGTSETYKESNVSLVGEGVNKLLLDKSVDVLLQNTAGNWYSGYSLGHTTILTVNTSVAFKKGDVISNILQKDGLTSLVGEIRTVQNNVPIGKGVILLIDRPFTNFVRNGYYDDELDGKAYFTTSAGGRGVLTTTKNSTKSFVNTLRIDFPAKGKYEVRLTRTTPDDTSDRKISDTTYSLFRSFNDDDVLNLDNEHTLIELSLRATEQINGVVQDLNALCKSTLRNFLSNAHPATYIETNNPAWIVLDILTGNANEGAILDNQIDISSFIDFANYCDEILTFKDSHGTEITQKRHTCNVVVTASTTVQDLVQSILSQSRASLKIASNGRYGVMFDIAKSLPVQLFTNRNSSGFSSERTYADIPHALKVKYVNPLKRYEIDECIVYADGYNEINAEKFEDLETFGITDYYEAWRHGRYNLAQIIAYQEVFSIEVDLEHLSVQRGDLVSVQNDVPSIGGEPLRITKVLENGLKLVTNDYMPYDSLNEYHYLVRADGVSIVTGEIDTVIDNEIIVLKVANPNIQEGDLFVYGFKDYVTADYIVNSITPKSDLKASLTLTPYNEAVYTADTGVMPEYDSGLSPDIGSPCRISIDNLVVDYEIRFVDRFPIGTINVTWELEDTANIKKYLVEWASELFSGEFEVLGYTNNTSFVHGFPNFKNNPEYENMRIAVRVSAVTIDDNICVASSPVEIVLKPDEIAPAQVDFFNINVVSETLNLTWLANRDEDISHYVIKYNSSLDATIATWENSVLLTDEISYNTLRHTTNARTGTYLIKAVDTSLNISDSPAIAITQIPDIVDLNFIEKIEDAPSWNGAKYGLVLDNGYLSQEAVTQQPTCIYTVCDGVFSDNKPWSDGIVWSDDAFDYAGTDYVNFGKYAFSKMIDLGDIYTPRINTSIFANATRAQDLMYTWARLSDIGTMALSAYDEWNTYITVRMSGEIDNMSTWEHLSDVALLSDGLENNWTDEALVEMGDFTGRYFRFYLYAETRDEKLRVNISNAIIEIDMPDRIISDNDIMSLVGGGRVDFLPAFYVSPSIGITQDNANEGDYFVITEKKAESFRIEFYDKNNVSVARQFDYIAKAYGSKSNNIIQRN